MFYSQDVFAVLGKKLISGIGAFENDHLDTVFKRRFGQHFGTTVGNLPILWDYCINDEDLSFNRLLKAQPEHLLWCLYHLKVYSTKGVSAKKVGADEKTFRYWTRIF